MKQYLCKRHRSNLSAKTRNNWLGNQPLFIGLASLLWLICQSGRKPSRISYPCQKAAAANVTIIMLPLFLPFIHKLFRYVKPRLIFRSGKLLAIVFLIIVFILSGNYLFAKYKEFKSFQRYQALREAGPIGKRIAVLSGASGGFLTIPHAMALPEPHRVVSVHHEDTTSWDFSCTSSGVCPEYYGDSQFVDQGLVDKMFKRGICSLTGAQSSELAWQVLLPDYQAGQIVAVKVNFNDSIMGGGISGYGDNDAYVDALPQVVNSVISGLLSRGVPVENIRVFDSSRYVTDRFRSLIDYTDVRYFDRFGNGDDVEPSTFSSTDPTADINFSDSGYPASSPGHKVSDVLVESDYLINIPIMKKHGGAGITLALKNHLGSINGFVSGGHAMHSYFYLSGSYYSSTVNPIVDINQNVHIRNKTILIVGDALYAGWSSNNTPPQRWQTFDNDSPNMLFLAVDPVAVDSVMFDYLDREGWVHPASVDILAVAAGAGLGVHERWNNDTDREYTAIDYIEIDISAEQKALQNVIKSLLISSGQLVSGVAELEDVDGDGKIGLEEAIHYLQNL